jgi:NAD(P)-dependent dehydrogenase (short-subunit alcohol dehydrogenase family)
MPGILEGKVALVTGVSHDGQVGQAVAKLLGESGTALAICARTQSNVEARAEELRQAGARVLALATSLTDESQVHQLIERTVSEYKKIDILVNLAGGLTHYKPAVEHSLDDWNHELNNNLLSSFLTSRAVFPHMREAGAEPLSTSRVPEFLRPTWLPITAPRRASRHSRARWRWKEEISGFASMQ